MGRHMRFGGTCRAGRPVALVAALALLTACGSTVGSKANSGPQAPGGNEGLGSTSGIGGPGAEPAGGGSTPTSSNSGPTGAAMRPGGGDVLPGTTPTGTNSASSPRGSAPVTTPIEIGYVSVKSGDAVMKAIGSESPASENPEEAFTYFVNALNARGGLNGRKIRAITYFADPMSSNYDQEAQTACSLFTQDHHVAVAFSFWQPWYSQNFSACMSKAKVPEFFANYGGTGRSILNQFNALFSLMSPTVERRFSALITGLSNNGFLSTKNKIGVVVEDCPFNQAAYTDVIAPALRARGFTANRRDVDCVTGFNDAGKVIPQVQSAVLPFVTAGVDRVMFVSGFERLLASNFEKQAENQHYAPHYALTSAAGTGVDLLAFSSQAYARVEGVGWEPDLDVTSVPASRPQLQRCRDIWRGYPPAADRFNFVRNDLACAQFFTLEAALKLSNGNSSEQSIVSAMRSLGSSFASATGLQGATSFSARQDGVPRLFSTFGYGAVCGCFRYTSAPKPLA